MLINCVLELKRISQHTNKLASKEAVDLTKVTAVSGEEDTKRRTLTQVHGPYRMIFDYDSDC